MKFKEINFVSEQGKKSMWLNSEGKTKAIINIQHICVSLSIKLKNI